MGGYGGNGKWPDFNAMLTNIWCAGESNEVAGSCSLFWGATNLVFGANPPYFLDDFLSVYPKFFGQPTALSNSTTVAGSPVVTVQSTNGLNYGQFLQAWGTLPKGCVIIGIGNNQVTLNQNATASSSTATLMVYEQPPIPTAVIQMYLSLATAALPSGRWCEMWWVAVGWYTAHYCTIYAQTDASEVMTVLVNAMHGETPSGAVPGTVYTLSAAPPGGALQSLTVNGLFQVPGASYTLIGNTITLAIPTPAGATLYSTWPVQVETFSSVPQTGAGIAAQGLAGGIQVSKGVGDVSVSYAQLTSLEQYGAWQLTKYGQLLATQARSIGSGPMLIH